MSTARPPYRAGDQVFAIWLEPGQGTLGGTRTVTGCTPRPDGSGWRLAVAVSGERPVTYLLNPAGHSDYISPAAQDRSPA